MTRLIALVIATLVGLAEARPAAARDRCEVPETLLFSDVVLQGAARQARNAGRLQIAILGSNSSLPAPRKGMPVPYTANLLQALQDRLPGIALQVENHSAQGLSAEQMVAKIRDRIVATRPDLLIWQTGTVDAARQIDLNDFGAALEEGLELLKQAGIDTVLMTPQYRARLAAMVDPAPYSDYIDQIGEASGILVFARYQIMQHWVENDIFDLRNDDQAAQLREAEAENRCLAGQLAAVIAAGIRMADP